MKSDIGLMDERFSLDALSPDAQRSFERAAKTTHYQNGTVLFRAGEPAQGVFLLQAGKVKLSAASNQGRSLVLRLALPGHILGLSATVRGKSHEVTAEAVGSCEAEFLSRPDFLRLLDRYPEACFQVVSMLSHELSLANEHVRLLRSGRTAASRLAALLLTWCAEKGAETDQGIRVSVPHTERDMGQMIGVSRETVARLFGKLRNGHVAEFSGGNLLVRDKEALESIATAQTAASASRIPVSGEYRI